MSFIDIEGFVKQHLPELLSQLGSAAIEIMNFAAVECLEYFLTPTSMVEMSTLASHSTKQWSLTLPPGRISKMELEPSGRKTS